MGTGSGIIAITIALARRDARVWAPDASADALAVAIDAWSKELIEPVFPGSSAKSEDWGPGGANQKDKPKAAPADGRKAKGGGRQKMSADATSAAATSSSASPLLPAGWDPVQAAAGLDEVVVIAPADDDAEARAFASRIGARVVVIGGPSDIPPAITAALEE